MYPLIARARLRREEPELEAGFTLIELLVVLLIIGILLAIAIPTYLSVTKTANATAAQANLQTALTTADTYYQMNDQSYSAIMSSSSTVSNISQIGSGVIYVSSSGNSAAANYVVVDSTSSALLLAAFAPGGTDCWYVVDNKITQTSTMFAGLPTHQGTYFGGYVAGSAANCTATKSASVDNWQVSQFPKL